MVFRNNKNAKINPDHTIAKLSADARERVAKQGSGHGRGRLPRPVLGKRKSRL